MIKKLTDKLKFWWKYPSDPSLFRVLFLPSLIASTIHIAYAYHWHWKEAIGITVSFLVHESAHAVPSVLLHIGFGIIITPLGAATSSELKKRLAMNDWNNVLSAALGPIATMALALILLGIGSLMRASGAETEPYLQLSGFNAALACMNLVPWPRATDGGKIARWTMASCNDIEDKVFVALLAVVTIGIAIVMFLVNRYLFAMFAFVIIVGVIEGKLHDDPAAADGPKSMGNNKERLVFVGYSVLLILSFLMLWLLPAYDVFRVAGLMLRLQ